MKNLFVAGFIALGTIPAQAQQHAAINLQYMDQNVRPQDDFYNYVNGNWMKTVEIPSDRARWGSFDALRENTDIATLSILKESIEKTHPAGSDGEKIANLYRSFMNVEARNAAGVKPIQPLLKKIDGIRNFKDLHKYLVETAPIGGNPFFGAGVGPDMKNSNANTISLGSASLGLGRSYYQKADAHNQKTLEDYATYIDALYSKINPKTKGLKGSKIVAFEKSLAGNMFTVEQIRDAKLRYNPVAVKDLKNIVKNIDLAKYLSDLGLKADTVNIGELAYYQKLDEVLKPENLVQIKEMLRFRVMNDASTSLTEELDALNFEFFGKKMNGQKEQRAMDKRGLAFVNGTAGDLLGKLYVEKHFPSEAKVQAEELVKYLVKSFGVHINNLTWMSPATKVKALEKLSKFNVKIGYPDKWKDYSKLKTNLSLYENVANARRWRFEENKEKQGKPVDKSQWMMTPQTVNAYYSSSYNEIVFPAAILQAPFYDYKADAAVNFGGIGAVIGHELSHGFDDSGSQYDGDGNLNNWWTDQDRKEFEKATASLIAQFNAFEPAPGVHVNGKYTLGENIGDLGGSSVAFDALMMYLADKGNPGAIDGFTPQQRFFLSWATIWRTKTTEAFVINQVKTDPHSPAMFRATGPLVNLDAFYEAFNIQEGDKLFVPKASRIVIW